LTIPNPTPRQLYHRFKDRAKRSAEHMIMQEDFVELCEDMMLVMRLLATKTDLDEKISEKNPFE